MSRRRRHSPAARVKHRERIRVRTAIVALIVFALAIYGAWIKHLPGGHPYEIRVVFSSSTQLRPGDPVRTAGIDVGTVTRIAAGPRHTALVSLQIDHNGRPVHSDATLQIEPRLALEGNFYIDLHPGSPSAPGLTSGAIVPLAQTGVPVQLDQALDVLKPSIRSSLQSALTQLAVGLGPGGPRSSAAAGFRQANRELDAALNSVTQVTQATQGTVPGDLTRVVGSSADTTDELSRDPVALADLVTNTNRVFTALAAHDTALAVSVLDFNRVLHQAPPALNALDAALPVLHRFAVTLKPALDAAPKPLYSAAALLGQLSDLASPQELPSLVNLLTPVVTELPRLESRLRALFPWVTPVSRCVSSHIVPVLDSQAPDGKLSTGRPVWQDALHAVANLASTSPDFDANGKAIRLTIGTGDQVIGGDLPGVGPVVAANAPQIEGTDPLWLGPGVSPAWRPDQQCSRQALPNLTLRRVPGMPDGMHSMPTGALTPLSSAVPQALAAKAVADHQRPGGPR
jgi:phospholipid/cholesterol/gamma-HCH transport system substrate-binding protein